MCTLSSQERNPEGVLDGTFGWLGQAPFGFGFLDGIDLPPHVALASLGNVIELLAG